MYGTHCIILVIVTSCHLADGSLPKTMDIGSGESLFLYWRPTHTSLTGCNVTTPTKDVNMFTKSDPNFETPPNLSFSDGYCCVKAKNIIGNDTGTWHLWATDGKNFYNTATNVTVYPAVVVVNRSVSALELSTFTLKCGNFGYSNFNNDTVYCTLRSPKGITTTYLMGPCSYTIYGVTVFDHEGVWTCSFAVRNFVTEFRAYTELSVVEDDTKEMILLDLPTEYVFYCKARKDIVYAKMCQITTPNGLDLYLTAGKTFGKYTYYGSKPSHCGVTIPKPLNPHDIGPWRCQLLVSGPPSIEVYGGYMTIGQEKGLRKIEVPSKKIFWTKETDHILLCHVPYVIEYCWFKSPTGTVYNIQDRYVATDTIRTQGFKFGDCVLSLERAFQNSTGTWTCNIGLVKESVQEISETIEIVYSDVPMVSNKKRISGELGTSLEIGCRTGAGKAINYCRLIRPDGKGLSVDPTKNNSDYSYTGKGFLYGYCGVTIHKLKSHDFGNWSCAAKLYRDFNGPEYTTHIYITEEKGSLLAVYIVVGIGGFLSLLCTGYVVVRKFEFKVNYRQSDDNTRLIGNDDDSNREETEDGHLDDGRSRIERATNIVKYVRRRSPRPPQTPESSYI